MMSSETRTSWNGVLGEFSPEGLKALARDLRNPERLPVRRSWSGCPQSYVSGYRGSFQGNFQKKEVGRDFRTAWDNDEITPQELLATVEMELIRRGLPKPKRHLRRRALVNAGVSILTLGFMLASLMV